MMRFLQKRSEDDEKIEVIVSCNANAMFYWELQYRPYIDILEPQSLRNRISEAVKEMCDKYCR